MLKRTFQILVSLTLLLGWGATLPLQAAPESRLRALVLEVPERAALDVGASYLLAKAGFEVAPLPTNRSPRRARADLIVLGSFASDDPGYARYMKRYASDLAKWIRDGGVVLQFTQNDRIELSPAFLPGELEAYRTDRDLTSLHVFAEKHPLLVDLVSEAKEGKRVVLPRLDGKRASWESFSWQRGFRVLLSADEALLHPAILEAAAGRGRVVLTSLWFDMAVGHKGQAAAQAAWREAAQVFFRNLTTYVTLVREGKAPEVPPTEAPATPDEIGEGKTPTTVTWKLRASDVAVYDARPIARHGKRDVPGRVRLLTVYGHDLRDEGCYLPIDPRHGDLPAILAFGVPPSDPTETRIRRTVHLVKTIPLRVDGDVAARAIDTETIVVTASYRFASRGSAHATATHKIREGTARVKAAYDTTNRVCRLARVELSYTRIPLDKDAKDKTQEIAQIHEYRLRAKKRTRYEGFRVDVARAIERGAEHLPSKQLEDGSFEPHGNWKVGTTALAILTLLACDVPATDPVVTKGLAWLETQEPDRTYALSLGLMAFAKAHAPTDDGTPKERTLNTSRMPIERRAWCVRTAALLEEGMPTPGSWTYHKGRYALPLIDTSNTQYAVLGLRAAVRLGIPVEEDTWRGVIRHVALMQETGGRQGTVQIARESKPNQRSGTSAPVARVACVAGFRYSTEDGHRRAWASMTCAGISCLAVARDELRRLGSRKLTPALEQEIQEMMLGGWAWMRDHWGVDRHPGKHAGGKWYYYFLYSLERAGILDDVRLVAGRDWYYEGALQLLERQRKDGSWDEGGRDYVPETCFALLFLKRATAPITPR